jgi:hypothetical protein
VVSRISESDPSCRATNQSGVLSTRHALASGSRTRSWNRVETIVAHPASGSSSSGSATANAGGGFEAVGEGRAPAHPKVSATLAANPVRIRRE